MEFWSQLKQMPNYAADKLAAAQWARDILTNDNTLILDSESTGLGKDARICQLAVIDLCGEIKLDTLINPERPIPAEATAIHGITDEMVKDAPTIKDLDLLFLEANLVIIYNADFDLRLLEQSGCDTKHLEASCAMKKYAAFCGQYNMSKGSYTWQKLPATKDVKVHSALGDCLSTLALIKQMAAFASPETVDDIPF